MKKWIVIPLVVGAAAAAWIFGKDRMFPPAVETAGYRLARIEKRDMVNSVSATGALSAVITVAVGSEVSGQIMALPVDFNSPVTQGQVIARIDPEGYETLLRQAEAELAMAEAGLLSRQTEIPRYAAELENARAGLAASRAQVKKAKTALENARRQLERQRNLVQQDFVSRNDFDTAQTAFDEAEAQMEQVMAQELASKSQVASATAALAIARVSITEAEAQVQLKRASLDKRRVDLDNTIIRSPVDGVVIDRSVDVGQTVAASLQAPTLFTIAQDLRKMQVSTSVDEADIGQIRQGQPARFTVDAYGTRRFSGTVAQIRKLGKTVQNVVTYEVIISADNPDLSLMPGMTADVEIELFKKPGVLAVPTAALRFTPPGETDGGTSEQPAEGTAGAPSAGSFPAGSTGAGRPDPEERIRRYTERLDLTPAQQDELRKRFKQIGQRIAAAREAAGSGPRVPMAEIRDKIRKETQAAVMGLLDARQQALFAEMSADNGPQRGTLWRLDSAGRPVSVPVTLGASDATHTEVAGSDLAEGAEVIVGVR